MDVSATGLKECLKLRPPAVLIASKRTCSSVPRTMSAKEGQIEHQKRLSIFDRPFRSLSGRRSVPNLMDPGFGFPFLRYKKPQPRGISCMIANKSHAYERRWTRFYELQQIEQLGKLEDEWDRLLERNCGLSADASDRRVSWATVSSQGIQEISATVKRHTNKETMLRKKFGKIRDREQALADQERAARRKEKQRQRHARYLAHEKFEANVEKSGTIELSALAN